MNDQIERYNKTMQTPNSKMKQEPKIEVIERKIKIKIMKRQKEENLPTTKKKNLS